MISRSKTRILAWLLICALIAGAFPFSALADTLSAAPLTSGATQNGMVRVRLSSLGAPAALNLTVQGSYTVNGQSSQVIASGSKITVKYQNGSLTLVSGGVSTPMGASFRLRRHESGGQSGIRIGQGRVPANLYPGDFQFTVKNGTYYIIAYIYMEDYLYGVLPYEMGASSPLEALKAQAIAARTYTMRAMKNASSSLYDVVDTTADQVYNGTPSGSAACVQAVDATRGIALQYGSAFAATYYTASNGGQIESIKNAWGVNGYPYLAVKDDPYDLNNPDARKNSFFVSASGTQSNSKLGQLLSAKAEKIFGAGAVITSVTAVTPHTPKYASPSKLYTKLDFAVVYQNNGASFSDVLTFDIFSELEGPLSMSINSGSNELWSVTQSVGGFTVTARRYGHGLGMSQRGAMQMAREGFTCAQILGFYFEGCTQVRFTLTRSILSPVTSGQQSQEQLTLESPAPIETPLPIASPTPAPTAENTMIYARVITAKGSLNLRQQPRANARVIRTIPQYETIPILEKGDAWCKTTYGGSTGYVMTGFLAFDIGAGLPANPVATPALTAAPVLSSGDTARVVTPQGSLNLREAPRGSARVIRTIPQFDDVAVLTQGSEWCQVAYSGVTGYVMTKFLSIGPTAQQPTVAPPIQPTVAPLQPVDSGIGQLARVNTTEGSLNLRQQPKSSARVILTMPQYDFVMVSQRGDTWCRVTYDGVTGYAMTKFLSFQGSAPSQSAAPASKTSGNDARDATMRTLNQPVLGRIMPTDKRLNLRKGCDTTATVILEMPKYDYLVITAVGNDWCEVEYEGRHGFCMTKYLEYTLYE